LELYESHAEHRAHSALEHSWSSVLEILRSDKSMKLKQREIQKYFK